MCAGSTASATRPSTKWRSRFGGMEISDARKLKALEDENRKLKKLLAETMLDASTLRRCWQKTSNAQLPETCCDLGDRSPCTRIGQAEGASWPAARRSAIAQRAETKVRCVS